MKVTIEEKITFSRIPFHTVLRGDCAKIGREDSLNITVGQSVRIRDGSKILLAFGHHLRVQSPKTMLGANMAARIAVVFIAKLLGVDV